MKKEQIENIENEEVVAVPDSEDRMPRVGELLKKAREEKKLKLVDIAQSLCIRRIYLEAIENSDYENIPEPPYGIGFIRSYAEYLGLNGEQMVSLFKNEITPQSKKNGAAYVLDDQAETSAPSKKYLLLSMVVVMCVYFGWSALNNNDNNTEENISEQNVVVEESKNEQPLVVEEFTIEDQVIPASEDALVDETKNNNEEIIENNQESIVSATTEEVVVEQKETTDDVETKEEKTQAPVSADKPDSRVVVKVLKETWVEVKDAQKLYISKVLQSGDIYALPKGDGMILSVGKSDGVEVWVDGKIKNVVKPNKKTNISVDEFLSANH